MASTGWAIVVVLLILAILLLIAAMLLGIGAFLLIRRQRAPVRSPTPTPTPAPRRPPAAVSPASKPPMAFVEPPPPPTPPPLFSEQGLQTLSTYESEKKAPVAKGARLLGFFDDEPDDWDDEGATEVFNMDHVTGEAPAPYSDDETTDADLPQRGIHTTDEVTEVISAEDDAALMLEFDGLPGRVVAED